MVKLSSALLGAALCGCALFARGPSQEKAPSLSRAAELARQGRPGPALALVKQALEKKPADKNLLLLEGNLLFRLGKYGESLAAYEAALKAGGGGEAWEGAAVAALAAGRPERALSAAARALGSGRKSLPLLLAGGRAALALGRPSEGTAWFRRALLLYPGESSPRVLLAQALLEGGKPREAARLARESLDVLGPEEGILRVLAAADLERGGEGEAADLLEFLDGLGKARARDLAALGDLKLRLGFPREALDLYRRARRAGLAGKEQLHREALALWSAGDFALAEKTLLSLKETPPAEWWVEVGRLRLARRDRAGAASAFRRALEKDPESDSAMLWLGRTALGMGKLDQAEKAFRLLLSRGVDDKEALLGLSEIWEKRGDPRKALALLRRARAKAPSDPDVLDRILRVERLLEGREGD